MNTLQEAFQEACQALGEEIVRSRLLDARVEQLEKQLLQQADPFETGQAVQKDVSHGD